jgi:protein-S-isoprenylcysteine O-methyltransferase Ste14
MLELRTVIGAYFVVNGVILLVYGILLPSHMSMSLENNLNIIWGCVMLFFGLVMLLAGAQGHQAESHDR